MKIAPLRNIGETRRPNAFTLIEMLVVIVIIGILITVAVPTFVSAMQGNRIAAAGLNLLGRLSQAQQLAMSKNVPIEVRFYKFINTDNADPEERFYAYQFLQVNTASVSNAQLEPIGAPYMIESGITIDTFTINGVDASPLLTKASSKFTDDNSSPGGVARQIARGVAHYVAIRFFPEGTVKSVTSAATMNTLDLQDAYITLVETKHANKDSVPNYFAVQIDPYTGHSRAYRPEL